MLKKINIFITILFIGFYYVSSLMPNRIPSIILTIGAFLIPAILCFISMIIEIKKEKEEIKKYKIRVFGVKLLLFIYLLFLVSIVFFSNQYRMEYDFEIFSKEHMARINIIPFKTISNYFTGDIAFSIIIMNLLVNLILLTPLAFFVIILYKNKIKNWMNFTIFILIFGIIIEILQFLTCTGAADIDDVILNTLGALITYLILHLKFIKYILKKVLDYSY